MGVDFLVVEVFDRKYEIDFLLRELFFIALLQMKLAHFESALEAMQQIWHFHMAFLLHLDLNLLGYLVQVH